jgi:putative transposase
MIDRIHLGGQVLVVALGIAEGGEKHVSGVCQGATENTTVIKGLLEDLVDRGLDLKRRYLVVIDESRALRSGVERVFGQQVEAQRCQIHKRRNVKEYLPENCQKDYEAAKTLRLWVRRKRGKPQADLFGVRKKVWRGP